MKTFVLPRRKALQTVTITMQTPFEELLGTPVDLPATEPETAQYEWTIASGDLPTYSVTPKSVVYAAHFYAAGKNTTAGAITVYYRMVKNGTSVKTGSTSVAANNFYTWNCYFYNVAVGDVLGIKLWAAAAGVNRDYQARQIQPTRLAMVADGEIMKPLNYSSVTDYPVLSQGTPSYSSLLFRIHMPGTTKYATSNVPLNISELGHHLTYKLFRLTRGDASYANSTQVKISTTYRPYYYRNCLPTQIIFRSYGELT